MSLSKWKSCHRESLRACKSLKNLDGINCNFYFLNFFRKMTPSPTDRSLFSPEAEYGLDFSVNQIMSDIFQKSKLSLNSKIRDSVFDSTLLYQTPIFSKSDLKSKFKTSFYDSKSKFWNVLLQTFHWEMGLKFTL